MDFPGGPVVKNLLANAGDAHLIPGWGTKIAHSSEGSLLISEYHPGTSDKEKHWNDLLGLEVVEENEWASHFPSELYLFIHSNEIFSLSFFP